MTRAAPLLLSSSITLAAPGQTGRLSRSDLTPRTLVPYVVTSIRMLAFGTPLTNFGAGSNPVPYRGIVQLQFVCGPWPMTDHFIPMWNFAPVREETVEDGGYYQWTLPRPLFVPAGRSIDVQARTDPLVTSGASSIAVYVALAGLLLPPNTRPPPEVDVPFVSCWNSTGGVGQDSDPLSLRNPLDKAIEIQRFVGRVQSSYGSFNSPQSAEGNYANTVQLFGPDGREITTSSAQFLDVFPRSTRALSCSGILPPNQKFRVRVGTPVSSAYVPMVSYVGTRKERT